MLDQYILWTLAQRDGKIVKLPVSPHTGQVCDHLSPDNWVSEEVAHGAAAAYGMSVGYVFTEDSPYFFIDVDKAYDPASGWSPVATDLCNRFPGAYIEVSQSGTGLHIIGKYSGQLDHGCKNIPLGIELYTSGRFCALTYNHAQGSPDTDHTTALAAATAYYFPPNAGNATAVNGEWSNVPRQDWSGPEDDAALIEIMLNARQSGASMFGGKASVKDLWEGNTTILAATYPDNYGDREYDASSADMALAQHLAFWTGCNHDRIWRLMWQSALRRDKWEKRIEYVQRTIINACGKCTSVYRGATSATPNALGSEIVQGYQFLPPTQQIEYFKGCVYVRDIHRVYCPDGAMLKPEQFRATYGGYVFALDATNEKTTKNAWEAFVESQALRHPKVAAICFRPECPSGAIIEEEGRELLNTYVPIETPRTEGDPSPFLHHLAQVLPDPHDREIFTSYMAAIVQYPGVKFQWAPLLQGCEGNGKTLFIKCVSRAVGNRYTHLPNAADLGGNGGKFNQWIEGKLFIGVEEIYVGNRREIADALKPLITNSRIEIQGKGANQITGDNRANFILCSNHKDAIQKTINDRRYCVLYMAQQSRRDMIDCGWMNPVTGDNTDYFPRLYNWLRDGGYEIVTHYLANYAIPDALNPAVLCQRAPVTSSTEEAVRVSLGSVEQEIIEAISEGLQGFSNGWISSAALDRMLDDRGLARRMPPNKRKSCLESLGYVKHPGLSDGRCNTVIIPEGKKPRLYIKEGSILGNITGASEITRRYMQDQGYNGLTPHVIDANVNSNN